MGLALRAGGGARQALYRSPSSRKGSEQDVRAGRQGFRGRFLVAWVIFSTGMLLT